MLGLYLAANGDYTLPRTVDQDSSLPSIVLNGTTFHAESFGGEKSEVVIVIHGGPGNDYRYLLDIKSLADKFRVIFYDQRGTGLSPRVNVSELTLDTMLSDLDSIVRHYSGKEPVKIIGHSWGAMLASAYVGLHPQMVSHVVLAEPGPLTVDSAREFLKVFKFDFGWSSIKKLAWLWFQSRHVENIDGQEKDDYFFTHLVNLDSDDNPMKGYFCDGRPPAGTMKIWRYSFASSKSIQQEGFADLENNPINMIKGVSDFKGKTLFLSGSCNSIIGAEYQRKYHFSHFPGAKFEVIDGSGHNMFSEKPLKSLSIVRKFFGN